MSVVDRSFEQIVEEELAKMDPFILREIKGWCSVHKELQESPYCEKQGQITKVFNCRICSLCARTGLCITCFLNQAENHYLAAHEETVGETKTYLNE